MALSDNSNMFMPVAPAYGSYGGNGNGGFFGNDFAWIILLLLIGGGGWGMGGFGLGGMMPWMMGMGAGMGGFGIDYLYPWLNNSQHISDGFRDQQFNTQIGDLRSDVNRGFGDVQLGIAGLGRQICETGSGITQALNNGFSAAEIAANGRQMANMQTQFGMQTAMQQGFNAMQAQSADCCCKTQTGIADLKYTVATENCADRAALAQGLQQQTMQEMSNTNALMSAIRDGIQSIKDELCNDRLDAERRDNANLRAELMYARGQASQIEQTAQIRANQATVANQLVSELRSCPIPSQPVYGNQPIFSCPNNAYSGIGCGCGAA